MFGRAKRLILWIAALLPGLLAPGAALAADRLHLAYTVYFGPLPALSVTVGIEPGGDQYRIEATVAPQPWIAWALPWQAHSEAQGLRSADGPHAQSYRATASWGSRSRMTDLTYLGGGGVRVVLDPAGDNDGREAVPPAVATGTLDPLGAVLGLLLAVDAGQGCSQTIPVFDGRRRFDIHGEPLPGAVMMATWYAAYAGPAIVCRLRFQSLAGGWRDGERSQFWRTDSGSGERPPMDLWLAKLRDGTPPIPVFVTGPSMLGLVTVYLSSYTIEPVTP